MKKAIFSTLFALVLGVSAATAQTSPSTKPAPPTTDQDVNNPQDNEDIVFPPDVVDSTLNDNTDINDTKVDSTMKMEDKGSYEKKEKTKRNKTNSSKSDMK